MTNAIAQLQEIFEQNMEQVQAYLDTNTQFAQYIATITKQHEERIIMHDYVLTEQLKLIEQLDAKQQETTAEIKVLEKTIQGQRETSPVYIISIIICVSLVCILMILGIFSGRRKS